MKRRLFDTDKGDKSTHLRKCADPHTVESMDVLEESSSDEDDKPLLNSNFTIADRSLLVTKTREVHKGNVWNSQKTAAGHSTNISPWPGHLPASRRRASDEEDYVSSSVFLRQIEARRNVSGNTIGIKMPMLLNSAGKARQTPRNGLVEQLQYACRRSASDRAFQAHTMEMSGDLKQQEEVPEVKLHFQEIVDAFGMSVTSSELSSGKKVFAIFSSPEITKGVISLGQAWEVFRVQGTCRPTIYIAENGR